MPAAIPIDILITGSIVGGNTFSATITLSAAAPAGGLNVQLSASGPVLPPSGSTFPLSVPIAAGSTNVTVTLGSNVVGSNTDVQVAVADAGTNIGSCANWRAVATARITP